MKLLHKLVTLVLLASIVSSPLAYTIKPAIAATPQLLGDMNLNGWCASINQVTAALASDGQTWVCTGNNQAIDFASNPTPNCVWQYNVSDAFAQQTTSGNPYTWNCYTGGTPAPTPGSTPTPTPVAGNSITKLQLINTDTQKAVIDPFIEGSTYNIGNGAHLNINAITNPAKVGSVLFTLDGKKHTENGAPYDDPGDTNGKFNPFPTPPTVGTHTLTVTPFTLTNATGTAGTGITIHFTITNSAVTPTPTSVLTPTPTPSAFSISDLQLINADNQSVILDPFISGTTINLGANKNLNINAITNPGIVGSVIFNLDGQKHTENAAPYALAGDVNGTFNPWTPTVGNHTLTVTAFSQANGTGTAGSPRVVTFTVTNTPITPTPTPSLDNLTDDWIMNKYDPARSNYDPANTAITTSTVANLKLLWSTPPASPSSSFGPHALSTTPIVVNKIMYYGDWSGDYFARNVENGNIIWQRNIGSYTPTSACNPDTLGVTDSAHIKTININGVQTSVVFIGGGDANMYALNAATGAIIWQTSLGDLSKGDFLWDSPVVYNGFVYEGVGSFGDCPLQQGRIVKINQATGEIVARTNLVPDGCKGAGQWASITVDEKNNKLYIASGTQDNSCKFNGVTNYFEPYALAVVEFDATTLAITGASRIPLAEQGPDSDYGVSPSLTTSNVNGVPTELVSAVNKNGRLYVFKRGHVSDGPIINEPLGSGGACPDCGEGSISTSATTGNNIIYQGGGHTTINGINYLSSIRAIDTGTGAFVWEHGLTKALVASPTLLKGLIIVPNGNNIDFINSATGAQIRRITPTGAASILDAPISVARGRIFVADLNGSMFVYGL